MKLIASHRVSENDDTGTLDSKSFILVNCTGYDEFDEPCQPCHRKKGRDDYYLAYTHNGFMLVRFSRKDYYLGEGDLFLYKPHEEQYYGQVDKENCSSYWVHFTGYGAHEAKVKAGPTFRIAIPSSTICFRHSFV